MREHMFQRGFRVFRESERELEMRRGNGAHTYFSVTLNIQARRGPKYRHQLHNKAGVGV